MPKTNPTLALIPKHPDEWSEHDPVADFVLIAKADSCWVEIPDLTGKSPGIVFHIWRNNDEGIVYIEALHADNPEKEITCPRGYSFPENSDDEEAH